MMQTRWFRMAVLVLAAIVGVAGFPASIIVMRSIDAMPTWYVCGWVACVIAGMAVGAWLGRTNADGRRDPMIGIFAGVFLCGSIASVAGVVWPLTSWMVAMYLLATLVVGPWSEGDRRC